MQREQVAELFGLVGTFPRPGWVVLDAARDHRFTGELLFDTTPQVRVSFDRGTIYLAERLTDPSVGARLVDAGALTAGQLERGSVRVGDVEHLGRLFERVPDVDRDAVVVTAEMMTDECVAWLAAQRVPEVSWVPYRHHSSGIHQWTRTSGWVDLRPGDPLPAPTIDSSPVAIEPPSEDARPDGSRIVIDESDPFLGEIIQWNEPSWLDGGRDGRASVMPDDPTPAPYLSSIDGLVPEAEAHPETQDDSLLGSTDWVDRLDEQGLPEADPLMASTALPRVATPPLDHFEIVWPSGEVDDDLGAAPDGDERERDHDRVGATARLARPDVPPAEPMPADREPLVDAPAGPEFDDGGFDAVTDEVVLAVRRAVASIEVGSLAARQRLVTPADVDPSRGHNEPMPPPATSGDVPEPGRLAVRSGRNDWSQRAVARSVFDEPAATLPEPTIDDMPVEDGQRERRAGALRRLIASLRR